MPPNTFAVLLAIVLGSGMICAAIRFDCSRTEYERCVRIADPLVKQVHLIFPDNVDDIDLVCRTWNGFVDCLKRYTERCFTEQQRKQFNKAVENPIESVHQMCTEEDFQREYLRYAPCMKGTVTDKEKCWNHYSQLVEQVDQGDIVSRSTLCCSHDRFKRCVLRESRNTCDRGVIDGPAYQFSEQIVDKALSFLQEQCYNYIPNSGDCSIDSAPISTSPSEIHPWSTVQAKEVPPSPVEPPIVAKPIDTTLGSRTRPASYGRSGSWAEPAPIKPRPENGGTTTPPPTTTKSDRATVTTWHVISQSPSEAENASETTFSSTKSTTETWYPAAGSQISNEVDEPNQQGLTKEDNGSCTVRFSILSLLSVVTHLFLID